MYSKILISGRLVEPADDKPRSGVTLTLYSVKNSSVVLKHATYRCVTGGNGEYSFNAAPGTYAVAVSVYGAEPERVGQIRVYSDSLPGDLNTFLMAPAEDDLTPEIIRLVDSMRSEAVKAAESAKQSEQVTSKLASDVATHAEHVASDKVVVEQKTTIATDAAATAVAAKEQTSKDAVATGKDRQVTQTKAQEATASANVAKAAQDGIVEDAADVRDKALQVAENTTLVANNAAAVQLNTEQVAKNTQTVTTKTQQVSENAQAVAANTQAVTQMRDEVVAKTSMAQAAADTATQKAASAAGHDAAAAEYARQAQEAAQATAGALMDGGAADLSAGVYPQPVVVSGTSRPTFWKVTKGGTVGGVDYGVGDTLIYTVAGSGSYYKIDNTESVTSVQGEKGAVTLTPEKIGAEPAGTAEAATQQHETKPGAHAIAGVSGLLEALASKLSLAGGKLSGNLEIESLGSCCVRVRNSESGALVQLEAHSDGALDIAVSPNGSTWYYPLRFNKDNNQVETGPLKSNGSINIATDQNVHAVNMFFRGGTQCGWVGSLNNGDVALYRDETNSAVTLLPNGEIAFTAYGSKRVAMTNGASRGIIQVDGELTARETTAALRCTPTAGGWDQWRVRAPAVLIDCQNQNSAYTVWKATHWGVDHIAAMQVHHRPDLIGMVRLQVKNSTFDFTGNGNLTCVSLTQLSDIRKKKNVSLLAGESRSVLDTLRQVEVIRYDENVCPDIDGRKGRIGYNAQQLVKVMPEMVHMDPDGFYSVAYTDMSAANTGAIQELVAMVETLQDKVESLMSERKDRIL
ncbi:prophage tail fiber N-terminal domain-containing protein [Plesiomonas shigelloides]|uniref:prophage tail fiber N-terminal domain-containing protein n=1 Tax=Plesiomonas shigelloides TaxID=703 RepID=UPI001E3731B6|nr:prophage tail fiber N-terminal domain-containing protein [Plesiomonas shigelloides]